MLTQRAPIRSRFTSLDARRLVTASVILILITTAILGSDILPSESLDYQTGDVARADVVAPRALDFESEVLTAEQRAAARANAPLRYDFSSDKAFAIAAEQGALFESRVQRIDTAFRLELTEADRQSLLETAVADLPEDATETLVGLPSERWPIVRTEAARVLDETLRSELRDTDVAAERTRLAGRMAGGLTEAERMLAADLIEPLVVPNSSFSETLTEQARVDAASRMPISRPSPSSVSASRRSTSPPSPAGCSWPCWPWPCSSPGCGATGRPSGIATTCSCSSACWWSARPWP
jgi:membrane-associated HD superfamily phosphohydrolase